MVAEKQHDHLPVHGAEIVGDGFHHLVGVPQAGGHALQAALVIVVQPRQRRLHPAVGGVFLGQIGDMVLHGDHVQEHRAILGGSLVLVDEFGGGRSVGDILPGQVGVGHGVPVHKGVKAHGPVGVGAAVNIPVKGMDGNGAVTQALQPGGVGGELLPACHILHIGHHPSGRKAVEKPVRAPNSMSAVPPEYLSL